MCGLCVRCISERCVGQFCVFEWLVGDWISVCVLYVWFVCAARCVVQLCVLLSVGCTVSIIETNEWSDKIIRTRTQEQISFLTHNSAFNVCYTCTSIIINHSLV